MLKRQVQKILQSEFWRNVATLASGSLVAQAFGVVSILVLPRLYNDIEFGLFGFFVASIAVTVVLINGGYEHAIMLPNEEERAFRLVLLSFWITVAGTVLILMIALFLGEWILTFGDVIELYGWHLLIPFGLLLEGFTQPIRTWLNRQRYYRALSWAKVARSGVLVLVSAGLGWLEWSFEGLILGYIAGQLAGLLVMSGYFAKSHTFSLVLNIRDLQEEGRGYGDFPRFAIFSAWLNTASKHLPFYMLIPLFDAGVAGQFNQADRVLMLPAVLISMSIGNVFYEAAAKAKQEGEVALAKVTYQTFIRLLVLAMPFLLVIMLWGPALFAWVLGEEWTTAGEYARWLMPWLFMVFMASPLSYLIDIQRKLKEFLYFNIALFIVRFLALYLGGLYFSAEETMMIYGLSGMVMVGLQLLYLLYIGGVFRYYRVV
jgi:lipopolysaccharide exporter